MIYKPRIVAPNKNNSYYYSDKNIFTRCDYGMPNCTCYAHGRYAELTGKWLPLLHNANTWFKEAQEKGLAVGTEPRLGAIACWDSAGAGHVAIVEAIMSNGNIDTSNSAYKGTEFYVERHYKKRNYNWTSKITGMKYTFQGFIYPTISFREPNRCVQTTWDMMLRETPEVKSVKKAFIPKGELLLYEGRYEVADGIKWIFVRLIEIMTLVRKNAPITGWVEDAYVKDFAPVVKVKTTTVKDN